MSKLRLGSDVLNEKLASVPLEISVVVKTTIAEYQKEISRLKLANARLRKLLDLVFKPDIQLHRLADLQQLTLTEEEGNPEQEDLRCGLEPLESDAEESVWDSLNVTTENRMEPDAERNRESESTSHCEPPSEVIPDSENSESDHGKCEAVENRKPLSGSKTLKSKQGRGLSRKEGKKERKEGKQLPDLKCHVCGKYFTTTGGLRRHLQNWPIKERLKARPETDPSQIPDLKCDLCGKCMGTARSLRRHRQNRHLEERPRGRPKKEARDLPDLKCDVCGKRLATARNLRLHRQFRHSDERPYMCDICGQGFILNCYLVRHIKTHTEEGQHCCTICGKGFNHKNNLNNHMRTHAEPAFKCDMCGKSLTTKRGLQLHQQNHTGEKSYPCKQCDKSFSIKGSLILHMRTHTGEKPFRCKECGKCFSDKGTLTKHMMTHTEEKPHRCNDCGKCFSLKGHLTAHMKVHTGVGVQCHLCGIHLKLASSLKRHLRTHR